VAVYAAAGVKFHDGSDFNADAVIWNLDKVLNDKAPQFGQAPERAGQDPPAVVASYAKIDDKTVEIHHPRTVDSFFPYQMLCSWSPAPRNTRSWARTGTSSPASPPAQARSIDKTGAARTRRAFEE